MYAGYHEEYWYRVMVKAFIPGSQTELSIHFVDYGDFNILSTDDLCPLPEPFRTLPCQAVKGSLAGVNPLGSAPWSEQAIDRFSDMVQDKTMTAWTYTMNENGFLSMTLVDSTTRDHNAFVHRRLIAEGLADDGSVH